LKIEHSDSYMKLGLIAYFRKMKGFTQEQLAERLGNGLRKGEAKLNVCRFLIGLIFVTAIFHLTPPLSPLYPDRIRCRLRLHAWQFG